MYFTGYTQVTSHGCNYITTAQECECAATNMGLLDTTAYVSSWGSTSRQPGCFYHPSGSLYFNTNSASTYSCSSDPTCVCRTTSYKLVSSGRSCTWITNQLECETAARALGFSNPNPVYVYNYGNSYAPGCWIYTPNRVSLYFNPASTSTANCGNGGHDCICRI